MNKLQIIFLVGFGLTATTLMGSTLKVKCSISPDHVIVIQAGQQQKKDTTVKVVYTCPMHPEVVQDKPGKCPKCKMNLVKKEVSLKEVYTCPMHSEVMLDKPGKCPKCKMKLVKKEVSPKKDLNKK